MNRVSTGSGSDKIPTAPCRIVNPTDERDQNQHLVNHVHPPHIHRRNPPRDGHWTE